jgi:glycine/D-amino acid oxidase-like deaminating enzyme/nitrite reductase/ring-hydroxylating ferredoxin subunit
MPEQYISIWRNTTSRVSYPPVKNNLSVDVAIIGGGIAGIMASWFLNKAGIKSALFESHELGCGTSGNTTAKVTSFHDLKYRYLNKKFGESDANIYAESNQWAIDELERIIREENITCDFSRIPLNVFALSDKGLKQLEKEFVSVKKLNLPATFTGTNKTAPFSTKGEIRFENQAVFHPGKFLNTISGILSKQDIKIFENSKIIKVEDSPVPAIFTRDAEIKAKKIIIATNYPVYDKGMLFLIMNQVRSYAIAAKLNKPVPHEMYIGVDSRTLYLRPQIDSFGEWLIISGADHTTGVIPKNGHDPFSELESTLRQIFDVNTIGYKWAAQDSMPTDRVPYIGKMPRTDNIYVTTGFGEWGMTSSIVSGKILADLINGTENKWADLYSPSRIKPSITKTFNLLSHVAKRLGVKFIPSEKYSSEKLNNNEGKIFNVAGSKAAIFKKSDGNLNSYSASCTHMGCIVTWNPIEKSWDCPCHGSRFDTNGQVLNSPSIKPLNEKSIKS